MRIAATCLCLALLSGCRTNTDPTTAAYWIDRLDDEKTRVDALKRLGKLGDKAAVPGVLKVFNEEGDWQPDAAYTLGLLGDASAAQQLIEAIDYQVGTGRDRASNRKNRKNQNIARALAMLKAPGSLQPLINLLKARKLETREAAIVSLGKLGDEGAVDDLIKLALREAEPFLRKRAIQALGDLRSPKSVPALVRALYIEMPGTSFYYEARFSLQQVGQAAVPALLDTLSRNNKEVEAIRVSGGPIAEGAIEAKAAFVLGALRATAAEDAVLVALSKYYKQLQNRQNEPVFASVPGAVMELCHALGYLGGEKAVKALGPVALDTDPNVRVAATEALMEIGDRAVVPTLLQAAKAGPAKARHHAVVALSRLAAGKELAAYNALAQAGGKEVTTEAMEKMLAPGRKGIEAAQQCDDEVDCWRSKLADADTVVRERAARELGWKAAKVAIPELLKATEDDDNRVRRAAVAALERMNNGLNADDLQAIHDRWSNKIAYRNANADLRRLIARLRSTH